LSIADTDRQHRGVFQKDKRVADSLRPALLDQLLLQFERSCVVNDAEATYGNRPADRWYLSARRRQSSPSSKCSSRSLIARRQRAPSAPSIRR
jgi:hypothetical protein